jgi:hypothetical protein
MLVSSTGPTGQVLRSRWRLDMGSDEFRSHWLGGLEGDADLDLSDFAGLFAHYGTTSSTTPADGDCDLDGDVDLGDLAQLLAHYGMTQGATYEDGDLDADGDVDLVDLAALLAVFGMICP